MDKSEQPRYISKITPEFEHVDHFYVYFDDQGNIVSTTGNPLTRAEAAVLEKEHLVPLYVSNSVATWQGVEYKYRDEQMYAISLDESLLITRWQDTGNLNPIAEVVKVPKRLNLAAYKQFLDANDYGRDLLEDGPTFDEQLDLRLLTWTTGENTVYLGNDGRQEILLYVDFWFGNAEDGRFGVFTPEDEEYSEIKVDLLNYWLKTQNH